jgi:IS30 family transposase
VSRGIAARLSSRAIAARIGHSPPTASREIARNGGRRRYRAAVADDAAWERARRPKPSRLASCPELRRLVRERLEQDWSPEQIAVWLKREHPKDASMRVSHETIYRSIYLSGRHELGPKPARHLRSGRMVRHARRAKQSHGGGVLRNMVSIRLRPAVVTERAEVGHWEGDLVMGKRPSASGPSARAPTGWRNTGGSSAVRPLRPPLLAPGPDRPRSAPGRRGGGHLLPNGRQNETGRNCGMGQAATSNR